MVTQQVLRRAGSVAVAAAVALSSAAALAAEPVGVLDLRPAEGPAQQADRANLERQLENAPGLDPVADRELADALAGRQHSAAAVRGRALAARARAADDCSAALGPADAAVAELAAARAAGTDVDAALLGAHATLLRCADAAGDTGRALAEAARIRALGVPEPPPGVEADLWSRYPPVDAASNVHFAELRVESEPAGAAVWIDHRPVGTTPLEVAVPRGQRLVVVAGGGEARSRSVDITGWTASARFDLSPAPSRWRPVRDRVAAWRRGQGRVDPAAVTELMSAVEVSALIAFEKGGGLAVWSLPHGARRARSLGQASTPAQAIELLGGAPRRWSGPGIDPDAPLLRETPEERARYYGRRGAGEEDEDGQEWWVYAALVGVVGVAAAAIVAHDLGSDRQRIEILLP